MNVPINWLKAQHGEDPVGFHIMLRGDGFIKCHICGKKLRRSNAWCTECEKPHNENTCSVARIRRIRDNYNLQFD